MEDAGGHPGTPVSSVGPSHCYQLGSVRGVERNGQENGERVGKLLKVNMSWKVVCVYVCVYRLMGGIDLLLSPLLF